MDAGDLMKRLRVEPGARVSLSDMDPRDTSGFDNEHDAKATVLSLCGVLERHPDAPSRKHLDTDADCARLWHERVRIPFRDYLQDEGLDP